MRDNKGRFVPGASGNPGGRSESSKHKLSESFATALMGDFESNGIEAMQICRKENPTQYLSIIAKVIPRDYNIKVDKLDEYTIDELERHARKLAQEIGIFEDAGDDQDEEASQHVN